MRIEVKPKSSNNKFFSLLLFTVICAGLVLGIKTYKDIRLRNEWKKNSSPLPQNKVDILCNNFGLDETHELCNRKGDVYGPEFYGLIQKTFKAKPTDDVSDRNPATYEQVKKKIGIFEIECEPPIWYDYERYRCFYDLRGDGNYLIFIGYNYPENTVRNITLPKGKEPHD